ncbi:hypothetical protein Gohar_008226 [Gossypium harknessii]|uniref:Uncharacterized protein n=1 Tax=Gossypium harknessii TaxID=34285 RepID=A0A7J9GIZ7_9ROSI|nr:hypothetical protein [Gossypium harknessii]
MSSLEKDRQDLLSTIEALQEEKKVLQSKLRDSFLSGKSVDAIKNPASKKDMSTSTEDLATTETTSDDKELNNTNDASSLSLLPEDGGFEVSSVHIPPDQIRMIQNINSLISELRLEKEELTQALSSELSQSSKLKEVNEELSRKLEVQTQRLELLTAQSLASEYIPARQPEPQKIDDNTPYADEGDEGFRMDNEALSWGAIKTESQQAAFILNPYNLGKTGPNFHIPFSGLPSLVLVIGYMVFSFRIKFCTGPRRTKRTYGIGKEAPKFIECGFVGFVMNKFWVLEH